MYYRGMCWRGWGRDSEDIYVREEIVKQFCADFSVFGKILLGGLGGVFGSIRVYECVHAR